MLISQISEVFDRKYLEFSAKFLLEGFGLWKFFGVLGDDDEVVIAGFGV